MRRCMHLFFFNVSSTFLSMCRRMRPSTRHRTRLFFFNALLMCPSTHRCTCPSNVWSYAPLLLQRVVDAPFNALSSCLSTRHCMRLFFFNASLTCPSTRHCTCPSNASLHAPLLLQRIVDVPFNASLHAPFAHVVAPASSSTRCQCALQRIVVAPFSSSMHLACALRPHCCARFFFNASLTCPSLALFYVPFMRVVVCVHVGSHVPATFNIVPQGFVPQVSLKVSLVDCCLYPQQSPCL
jgi:hypothetical protein